MIGYALRVLAVVVATSLKLVVAYVTLDYLMPVAIRFAESGMGVRAPLDGFGGGALYEAVVVAAFVATSAFAARGAGRERLLLACKATAITIGGSSLFMFATFAPAALSPHSAKLTQTQMYVKYPPFRAAEDLRDNAMPFGGIVLIVDALLTAVLVLRAKRRPGTPFNTTGTSTATT
jgi:hypothetical protein